MRLIRHLRRRARSYWAALVLSLAITTGTDLPRVGWWDLLRVTVIVLFCSAAVDFLEK